MNVLCINSIIRSYDGLKYFFFISSAGEAGIWETNKRDKEDGRWGQCELCSANQIPLWKLFCTNCLVCFCSLNVTLSSNLFSQTAVSPVSPELSPAPAPEPEPESEPEAATVVPMTTSEECYFCGQRVYVLERISAEGKFFHRSCFTCHQCSITLRLGGYTFDQTTGEVFGQIPRYLLSCPLSSASAVCMSTLRGLVSRFLLG